MVARQPGRSLRRVGLVLGAGAVVIILAAILHGVPGNSDSFPVPSKATLAGLRMRLRIVAIAESQVGYSTDPASSYCNKFSSYCGSGTAGCPSGENAEEWCADFAAWAWQNAGLHVPYGYGPGQIYGVAVSFYDCAIANGEWHPATGRLTVVTAGDLLRHYCAAVGRQRDETEMALVIFGRRQCGSPKWEPACAVTEPCRGTSGDRCRR